MIELSRRNFIKRAALVAFAAPAIVRASSLMAVKPLPETLYYQGIPLEFDYTGASYEITWYSERPELIVMPELDWDALLAAQERREARMKRDIKTNLFTDFPVPA